MFAALCSKTVAYNDDLVRNIKSIRTSQALFGDLADDPEDEQVAIAADGLEGRPSPEPIVSRPFDYGTVLSYSFDPANWQATRFSDARRFGVWYGSLDLKTTVYETVFHWHRFLMDSFPHLDREIIGERRVFAVACNALLVDLREAHKSYPALIDRRSYAFTQQLGRFLYDQGQNGLLVQSARGDGVNAAILNPARLSKVRDRAFLTYRCNPMIDTVRVERTPGRTWFRIVPSQLY